MILEIDNVELSYSGKSILRGVYLKAETSKVTALIGRNGSGKSCLLEIIFGSLKPKYGLLRIDGQAVKKPFYTTGKVGILSQESFLPNNVKLKTIFKLYKANWKEFLSIFPDFLNNKESKPKRLSTGEIRLVESFIVIKGDYDILLLDEPFSHIAPVYVNKISNLIKDQKKNKAIIISDHSVDELLPIADTVYLLKNGCTIEITDKSQLYDFEFLRKQSEEL